MDVICESSLAVGSCDAAAVEDAEVLGDLGVDVVLQPLPQRGVHLLRGEQFNRKVSVTVFPLRMASYFSSYYVFKTG